LHEEGKENIVDSGKTSVITVNNNEKSAGIVDFA
jgi:hypothetical protein